MELKTKDLILRPIRLGDEEQIHEYAGDKDITMMFWLPNDTFEETCDFVRRYDEDWKKPFDQIEDFEFVITLDGKIIGGCDCDLSHSEDHTYATLGWIINKNYRGRGFASQAGAALIDFAFNNLKIERILAQCDCKNAASFGVMKKIGMRCIDDKGTRTYPKTGITSGEYTCQITRTEWSLIIRPEKVEDYKNTELMTMRSFWNKYFPGCVEHNMLRVIRESADYLPEISRVAELDGKIVGAAFYTKAWIVGEDGVRNEVAMLGPLAVEPTLEGKNIGGKLICETIHLAKEAGIAGIILCGEPGYYPKFGFKLMKDFGITDLDGKAYDAYLCYPLNEKFATYKGHFEESPDFEKIEDPAALEKISKEFPAYRKVKVQEGFMQIFNQHLGVVESMDGEIFNVRYWELVIPCKLAEGLEQMPAAGCDVQFIWNHKGGESEITKIVKNILDDE